MDKSESFVVVDKNKQQILKQPQGNHFTGLKINGNYMEFKLHFKKEFHAMPFSRVLDGNGKELVSESGYMNEDGKGVMVEGIEINGLASQTNPLSLELSAYPSWIKGEEKIKIK